MFAGVVSVDAGLLAETAHTSTYILKHHTNPRQSSTAAATAFNHKKFSNWGATSTRIPSNANIIIVFTRAAAAALNHGSHTRQSMRDDAILKYLV